MGRGPQAPINPNKVYEKIYKVPAVPRVSPFASSSVDAYVQKYWAVMFTSSRSSAVRTKHMQHLVNWYCTRCKLVDLDHHTAARTLISQLQQRMEQEQRPATLPILFVNKRLIGTLEDVQQLEADKKLKDVLQFGFEWKLGREPLGPLPSAYADKELFLGRYVGAPVAKPVMKLPSLHPLKFE